MKKSTKQIVYTAMITATVALVVESIVSRLIKKADKVLTNEKSKLLSSATKDELIEELEKRRTQSTAMSGAFSGIRDLY